MSGPSQTRAAVWPKHSYEKTLAIVDQIKTTLHYKQVVHSDMIDREKISFLIHLEKQVNPNDGDDLFKKLVLSTRRVLGLLMFQYFIPPGNNMVKLLDSLLAMCNTIFAVPSVEQVMYLDRLREEEEGLLAVGHPSVTVPTPAPSIQRPPAPLAPVEKKKASPEKPKRPRGRPRKDSLPPQPSQKTKEAGKVASPPGADPTSKKKGAKTPMSPEEAAGPQKKKMKKVTSDMLHSKKSKSLQEVELSPTSKKKGAKTPTSPEEAFLGRGSAGPQKKKMKKVTSDMLHSKKSKSLQEVELSVNAQVLQQLSRDNWPSPSKASGPQAASPNPSPQPKPVGRLRAPKQPLKIQTKRGPGRPRKEDQKPPEGATVAVTVSAGGQEKGKRNRREPAAPAPPSPAKGELVNMSGRSQDLIAVILAKVFGSAFKDLDPSIKNALDLLQGESHHKTAREKSIIQKSAEQLRRVLSENDAAEKVALASNAQKAVTTLVRRQFTDVSELVHSLYAEPMIKRNYDVEATLAVAVKNIQSTSANTFPLSIKLNSEPYLNSDWNKQPYPRKEYEQLEDYELAGGKSDKDQIGKKLKTLKMGHRAAGSIRTKDLEERNVWGFDCYTRRNIEDAVIECGVFCADGKLVQSTPTSLARTLVGEEVLKATCDFVDGVLMPGINANVSDHAWDLRDTVRRLMRENEGPKGDPKIHKACLAILERVDASGLNYFRIHPKGRGVICAKKDGIPKSTFISKYLGEVYLPSRWFELQDSIKKLNPRHALLDFYNMVLERPKDDPTGYDVLFVDAQYKGAIASRVSHSCTPNCQAEIVSNGGNLSISIYTVRDIAYGEELSFDYSCVTESKQEYREAICLCGMSKCRGSFLSLADGKAYEQVMQTHHTFLHRNAIILKACSEEMSEADYKRLHKFGFRSSLLGALGSSQAPSTSDASDLRLPPWLVKWVSLTLSYVEEEEKLLPSELVKHFPTIYNQERAEIESKGVTDQRVQNLAITIDKLKRILMEPGQAHHPPLCFLSEKAHIDHLWTGPQSIARRAYKIILGAFKQIEKVIATDPEGYKHLQETITKIDVLQNADPPATVKEAQERLLTLSNLLKAVDTMCKAQFTAMIALLRMNAFTERFFSNSNFVTVTSSEVMQKKHIQHMDNSRHTMSLLEKLESTDVIPGTGKRYNQTFVWGQLIYWYKQTIYEPNASLSAERRGTVSLPDVESSRKLFSADQRGQLVQWVKEKPEALWRTNTIWSFRNAAKIYGSPWLDAVMKNPVKSIDPELVKDYLKNVFEVWE